MKRFCHSQIELTEFFNELNRNGDYPVKFNYSTGKMRSLPANDVQWVFYKEISNHTGEDVGTVANRMKRDIGFPILMGTEHSEELSWILKRLSFHSQSDEVQLAMMKWIPVTSLFNSKCHTEFRDNMISFWRSNGLELEYLSKG